MDEGLLETLPLAQRLALSYAPKTARSDTLGLFALEERLARIVSGGGEPMIAQLKLSWWRDRFSQSPDEWPEGEPLLSVLSQWSGDTTRLASLVDGWEGLLAERLDRKVLAQFLRGKALAWSALADGLSVRETNAAVQQAVEEIALFDLVHNLSDPSEIALVEDRLRSQPWTRPRLSRRVRPVAVLHALARRARGAGRRDLLDGPGAMATAMRVGITGR